MDSPLKLPQLDIPGLLRSHQLRPKKGLGQNFLIDAAALARVTAAAEIMPGDLILEIGPGLGSLTRYLSRAARRVVAVELDAALIPVLQEVLRPFSNVEIVQGDILEINPAELVNGEPYKVVANIPYYITSAVIRHLLDVKPGNASGIAPARPDRITLTVQKEVAQRICAGASDMSLLALSVQVFGAAQVVAQIPAGAFYPAPEVDSAVVRIDLYPRSVIPAESLDRFFTLARAGFSQKRKKLRNSLSSGLHLPADEAAARLQAAGIDPNRRAETLSLEEWKALVISLD